MCGVWCLMMFLHLNDIHNLIHNSVMIFVHRHWHSVDDNSWWQGFFIKNFFAFQKVVNNFFPENFPLKICFFGHDENIWSTFFPKKFLRGFILKKFFQRRKKSFQKLLQRLKFDTWIFFGCFCLFVSIIRSTSPITIKSLFVFSIFHWWWWLGIKKKIFHQKHSKEWIFLVWLNEIEQTNKHRKTQN